MIFGDNIMTATAQAAKAIEYARQQQAATPTPPAAPSAMSPAQAAEHERLKAIWVTTTNPAQKDAAYKALVAFDTQLPPPPPPPAPDIAQRSAMDFFTANRGALLVVSGLALAGGVGFWLYKRGTRR